MNSPARPSILVVSYFGTGQMRERYLGVKIPPANLTPDYLGQGQGFASKLADSLDASPAMGLINLPS